MNTLPDPSQENYPSQSNEPQHGEDKMSLRRLSPEQSTPEGIALPPPAARNDDASHAGLDLSAGEAALAIELGALSESLQPDSDFVTRLQGELTRKRIASRPRRAYAPTLVERLRLALQSAWGWMLPAGAVILLIIAISLLLQMRPRQTVPSGEITATRPQIDSATSTPIPPFTIMPISVIAPTTTVSPTPVPPGVFVIQNHSPAILNYDLSVWNFDEGKSIDRIYARDLETCQLGTQGPSDYFPSPDKTVTLGNIDYQVGTWIDTPPGGNTSYYFYTDSLAGYDYSSNWIILTVSASSAEWEQCRALAEQVLSTLHAQAASAPATVTYIVKEGDTLLEIAKSYGIAPDVIYEANELLQSEGVLRPGMTLIIPLAEATVTPILPSATPASGAQALLDELHSLVATRRAALLTGPGWIHLVLMRTNANTCGSLLPNGAFTPCEITEHDWYELNARGEVVTVITRQYDESDRVFQEVVTRDGVSRNLTFGYESTTTLTTTYETDWGFAASAAEGVARGVSISQVDTSIDGEYTGQFILLLAEGDTQRDAVFDPLTGGLLSLSTWVQESDGLTQIDSMKIQEEVRVDQPTDDALALLDQPTPPYQPLPPQGESVPAGFDLAHSRLGFRTLAGDAFIDPTFWYGDVYADGTYLVGRVDFGAVSSGFCQRSPDGTRLAFDHVTLSNDAPAIHQLRWLDLNNPSDVYIPPFELQLVSPPVWSPDSARMAFTACDAVQNCGFYTYDTGTGSLQRLAGGGNATPPVWSPDEAEIAFQTGPGESPQTVVVNADTGSPIASPSWQPQFSVLAGFSQCEIPPALAPTLPEAPAEWPVYANSTYGFSFRYPPAWTVEEQPNYIFLKQGTLQLSISVRYLEEQAFIGRTGVAAGDIVHDGHLSFLGLSLPRYLLVYEGKDKAILFGMGIPITRGNVIFTLSLDDFSLDYDAIDLTTELQQQVSQMIESFTWIPVPPPQSEPTVTPTAQPSVLVVIAVGAWEPIYTGPGPQYPQAGEVVNGLRLVPVGRTADESWIEIHRPGYEGQTAWIAASAVSPGGAGLGVVTAPPLPESTPQPSAPLDSMRIAGRIAFISMRDGYPVLYAMNADGSGLTMLVNDLGMLMDPIWSPDGQALVFSATSRQTYDLATFTIRADGGGWSELPVEDIPAWADRNGLSPDGTRKAYVAEREGGLGDIYISAADGSNPVRLSGEDSTWQDNANPAWSLDGSQIAYISWLVDENGLALSTNLFIVAADGTQRSIPLTNRGVVPGWPSWSPDGQDIAYVADGDIYVVQLADGQIWRLTENPANDYAPAWNPSASLPPLPGARPTSTAVPVYTAGDEDLASQALAAFLEALHAGQYSQAEGLYGGMYDVLADNNWGLDPSDKSGLLKNACEVNGFQCLQVRSAGLVARSLPGEYVFVVEFTNADGSLFVQGPCCGASEADWTPISQFEFVVVKVAGSQFVVLQLPPLMP